MLQFVDGHEKHYDGTLLKLMYFLQFYLMAAAVKSFFVIPCRVESDSLHACYNIMTYAGIRTLTVGLL